MSALNFGAISIKEDLYSDYVLYFARDTAKAHALRSASDQPTSGLALYALSLNQIKMFDNISDETKTKVISHLKTFGTVFIVTAAATLVAADEVVWSVAFWLSIGGAAIRAGVTALIAPYLPVRLGGKKV